MRRCWLCEAGHAVLRRCLQFPWYVPYMFRIWIISDGQGSGKLMLRRGPAFAGMTGLDVKKGSRSCPFFKGGGQTCRLGAEGQSPTALLHHAVHAAHATH